MVNLCHQVERGLEGLKGGPGREGVCVCVSVGGGGTSYVQWSPVYRGRAQQLMTGTLGLE